MSYIFQKLFNTFADAFIKKKRKKERCGNSLEYVVVGFIYSSISPMAYLMAKKIVKNDVI